MPLLHYDESLGDPVSEHIFDRQGHASGGLPGTDHQEPAEGIEFVRCPGSMQAVLLERYASDHRMVWINGGKGCVEDFDKVIVVQLKIPSPLPRRGEGVRWSPSLDGRGWGG